MQSTGPMGVPETTARRPSRIAVTSILALLATAVAYRDLVSFDPAAGRPRDLDGVDALFFEPGSSSPWLVYAVTVWLLARRWGRLREAIGTSSNPASASVLLLVAAGLCLWGYHTGTPAFQVPSLSLVLMGGSLLLGGSVAFRAVLPPALFLLLAISIPTAIVNQFMYPLQLATAEGTAALLGSVGIHAVVQGELILRGDHVFQVIESCSGLRMMETLVMAAAVYVELLGRSRLHGVVLVLAAPLIGLATNQLRVCLIVLNPYSDVAAIHTVQGIVMIVFGVLWLAAVDALLARLLQGTGGELQSPGPASLDRRGAPWPILTGFLGILSLGTLAIEPWSAPPARGVAISKVPAQLAGWSASGLPLDKTFLGSVTFSEWVHRLYRKDGETVDLLVGEDDRLGGHAGLLSSKTAVLGPGWEVVERWHTKLENGRRVEAFRMRSSKREALVYRWYIGVESRPREVVRSLLAIDRSRFRPGGRAVVVRVGAPVASSAHGAATRSDARLRDFAPLVDAEISKILAGDGRG